MEIRKLQQTGGSSLSLVLPKKWTSAQKLQDKDEILIIPQQSGSLLIQPQKKQSETKRTTLLIDDLSREALIRELIALYLMGVDEIAIKSKKMTAGKRENIREALEFLIGFAIVDESVERTMIKNIFDVSKFPIPKNVENMFDITRLMFMDALKALIDQDKNLALDVAARDFEVDKLHFMITRQYHALVSQRINEEDLGITHLDLSFYERIASQIERIADHCIKVAQVTPQLKKNHAKTLEKDLRNGIKHISGLLQQTVQLVKKMNKNEAHAILESNRNLEKLFPLFKEKELHNAPFLLIISDSFDRIRGYLMNIAELMLDYSIAKKMDLKENE